MVDKRTEKFLTLASIHSLIKKKPHCKEVYQKAQFVFNMILRVGKFPKDFNEPCGHLLCYVPLCMSRNSDLLPTKVMGCYFCDCTTCGYKGCLANRPSPVLSQLPCLGEGPHWRGPQFWELRVTSAQRPSKNPSAGSDRPWGTEFSQSPWWEAGSFPHWAFREDLCPPMATLPQLLSRRFQLSPSRTPGPQMLWEDKYVLSWVCSLWFCYTAVGDW